MRKFIGFSDGRWMDAKIFMRLPDRSQAGRGQAAQ